MKLINGRGQLGEALSKEDIPDTIYHTWNHLDKTEETQKECFEKFKKYREQHPDERIILISTDSDKNNPYVKYKRKAEELADGVVRLPLLIGKGACERLRDGHEAYGYMELNTIEDAVETIKWYAKSGKKETYTHRGFIIPAYIVKKLIQFGNAIQRTK